jgi:hypothetical protein
MTAMRWPYRRSVAQAGTARAAGTALAAAAALTVLTACGSLAANGSGGGSGAGAGGGQAARPGGLCASRGQLTALTVKRTGVLSQLRQEQTRLRAQSTVGADRARTVAASVCALPRSRKGTLHCPADIGIDYKLSFTAGARHFRTVTAHMTGCQQVTGAGKPRTAQGRPSFWVTLARDVQLPPVRFPVNQNRPGQDGSCQPSSTSRTTPGNCPGPRVPA